MADSNYYELLRLDPSATPDEIRAAYIRISKLVHPDRGGSEALFRQVSEAYETLSDPTKRAAYDRGGDKTPSATSSNSTAPGWRRTDTAPPNGSGPRTRSTSGDGASDKEPPKREQNDPPRSPSDEGVPRTEPPSAPRPPRAPSGYGTGATKGHDGEVGSQLRQRAATHPSLALLVVGVLMMFVATQFGSAASGLIFLGLIAAVVGFVGALGRSNAARRNAVQRAGIASVDNMTEADFEHRLRLAFEREGYTVYKVGGADDFGADLVVDGQGTRTVVQTKHWNQSVGPDAIEEVVASRAHYNAGKAVVMTNGSFTKAALELARSKDVEIWDRSRLKAFLAEQELGHAHTGGALLADELRAGAPTALKGLLLFVLGLASAASNGSKRGQKRKKNR